MKKTKKSASTIEMNPNHVRLLKIGLLKVQRALQETLRPRIVKESFAATGVWPLDAAKIIRNCRTAKLTVQDMDKYTRAVRSLAGDIEIYGRISDQAFADWGINPTTEARGVDHLVLCRRRAELLTHDAIFQHETQYRANKGTKRQAETQEIEEEEDVEDISDWELFFKNA
jgi:DNA polymerase I-like protein with 3'-5' exonuclease and polymerase domains